MLGPSPSSPALRACTGLSCVSEVTAMPDPKEFAYAQFDLLLTACVRIECMMSAQSQARLRELCAESLEGDPGTLGRQVMAVVHGYCETGLPVPIEGMASLAGKDALELFASEVFDAFIQLSMGVMSQRDVQRIDEAREALIGVYEGLKSRLIR